MIAQPKIYDLLDKAVAGERLNPAEGLRLLESSDLTALGRAADEITRRLHPEPYRTYNIDRNINYTNACTAVCDFCAFYRPPNHPKSTCLSARNCTKSCRRRSNWEGTRFCCKGGCIPNCRWNGTKRCCLICARTFRKSIFMGSVRRDIPVEQSLCNQQS